MCVLRTTYFSLMYVNDISGGLVLTRPARKGAGGGGGGDQSTLEFCFTLICPWFTVVVYLSGGNLAAFSNKAKQFLWGCIFGWAC